MSDKPSHNEFPPLTISNYGDLQNALKWLGISATAAAAQTVYPGQLNSDGSTGTPFPTGWTATRISAGVYKITHNLGTTNYSFIPTVFSTLAITICNVHDRNANDVSVTFYNQTGSTSWSATDTAFSFVLIPS
jgi:hypothetical protein